MMTVFFVQQVENKIDNQVKAGFIPTSLAAHPDGSVVLALGEKGLLQCFDIALSPVQLAFPNEEQLTGNILDIRQGAAPFLCWLHHRENYVNVVTNQRSS
jgi:WD repeat-containing and planar cell polarity effector protein Fritz